MDFNRAVKALPADGDISDLAHAASRSAAPTALGDGLAMLISGLTVAGEVKAVADQLAPVRKWAIHRMAPLSSPPVTRPGTAD